MKPNEKQATETIKGISGIANASAQAIIAVIGTDMSCFPTDAHLSSWAGLYPENNESARKTRKWNALLHSIFVVCAHSVADCKDSFFHTQFEKIRAYRGEKQTYVAVAQALRTFLSTNVSLTTEGILYYYIYR